MQCLNRKCTALNLIWHLLACPKTNGFQISLSERNAEWMGWARNTLNGIDLAKVQLEHLLVRN